MMLTPIEAPQVRVFISSTFHDMHMERDELVRRVFTRLRVWADEWEIDVLELDLRWGIPKDTGVFALHECLRLAGECLPFFIGLLGHRYGSPMVLEQIDDDTLAAYPWLVTEAWNGASYTELEFAVAMLRSRRVAVGTLVYCRSEEFSREVGAPPIVGHAGADMQARLRARVRALGAVRRPEYNDARELGAWIEDDLKREIRRRFAPWFDQFERLQGGSTGKFGLGRTRSFAGRERVFQSLNKALLPAAKPILVTGDRGAGRTALLQIWSMLLKGDRPPGWSIQSWWGGGASARADRLAAGCARAGAALTACLTLGAAPAGVTTGWVPVAARLLEALRRISGGHHTEETATSPAAVRQALAVVLSGWPEEKRVLICLDDADLLAGDLADDPLAWLPAALPSSIHFVASMADDVRACALARHRRWRTLQIPHLDARLRREIAVTHFAAFGKRLGQRAARQIAKDLPAVRPLTLLAALEDLRFLQGLDAVPPTDGQVFFPNGLGTLDDRLSELCRSGTDEALQTLVLSSLRTRFQEVQPGRDLAGDALRLLACARSGLTEGELLTLLGCDGAPLPTAVWLPLRAQVGAFLNDYGGRLLPARSVRPLIQRELLDPAAERKTRDLLVTFFQTTLRLSRQVEEIPWQLRRMACWRELFVTLCDQHWLEVFWVERLDDLFLAWSELAHAVGQPLAGCVASAYQPRLASGGTAQARLAMLAALQLSGAPLSSAAQQAFTALRQEDRSDLRDAAQQLEAAWWHRLGESGKAVEILQALCARENPANARYVTDLLELAQVRCAIGQTEQAEQDLARAESLVGSAEADHAPSSMTLLRVRLWLVADAAKLALALALRLANRARLTGELSTLIQAEGLAGRACQQLGRYKASLRHHRRETELAERTGDQHALQAALGAQAEAMYHLADLDQAVALLRRRYALCEELGEPLGRIEIRRQFASLYGDPLRGLRQPALGYEYLQEALGIAREKKFETEVATILREMEALSS